MAVFKHLVRFAQGGETHYGDLIESASGSYKIKKLKGSPFEKLEVTDEVVTTDTVSHIPFMPHR